MKQALTFKVLCTYLSLLVSLFLFRWQFWAFNHRYFSFQLMDFIHGVRFDLSLVGYLAFFSLPMFLLLGIIPNLKWRRYGLIALSLLLFIPCLLTECWDLVYFQYTLKRCSFDLYLFFGAGEDQSMWQPMLQRFWHLPLLWVAWTAAFLLTVMRIYKKVDDHRALKSLVIGFSTLFVLAFIIARNSFGPKPLGILDATSFDAPARSQLVLNSPFVVLKTLHNKPLTHREYMSREEEKKYFNPLTAYGAKSRMSQPNLIFFVLESFGAAQLRDTVNGLPLTPFLDSLFFMDPTTVYTDGLSNGKTSIECLPAIFAGIPSLQEVPYVISNYCTNEVDGFPQIARARGYSTLFFHGADEGSMRFGTTVEQLGFKSTFFKPKTHANPQELGSWGYHDGAVFTTMLKELSRCTKPFLSAAFTLSSHEPYDLPAFHQKKYPQLPKEASSYRYTDDCLRAFFMSAKKEPWFANTLIIITGDHTPVHLDNSTYSIADYYRVPIAVVNGKFKKQGPIEHLNIVPWLCETLGWRVKLYGYGNDLKGDHVRYLNGIYHVWNQHTYLEYNEHIQQWKLRVNTSDNPRSIDSMKKRFLAKIQRFRNDLRWNTLHP